MATRGVSDENEAALPGTLREIERNFLEWKPATEAELRALNAKGKEYDAKVRAIIANPDLSLGGAEKEKTTAGVALAAWLAEFERTKIAVLRARIESVETSIAGSLDPPEPANVGEAIARALRQEELRDLLRDAELSAAEILAVYLNASDAEVVEAIEDGFRVSRTKGGVAMLVPMIDDAAKSAAIQGRAEALQPEQALLLRKLNGVLGIYTMFLESLRRALFEQCPILRPAPTSLGSKQPK